MKRAIFALLMILLATSAFAIATGYKSQHSPPKTWKFTNYITGRQAACNGIYSGIEFYGEPGRQISGPTCDASSKVVGNNICRGKRNDATCICDMVCPSTAPAPQPAPQPAPAAPQPTGCRVYSGIEFYGEAGRQISGPTCDASSKVVGNNMCRGKRNDATCICDVVCPSTAPAPVLVANCNACVPNGDCNAACTPQCHAPGQHFTSGRCIAGTAPGACCACSPEGRPAVPCGPPAVTTPVPTPPPAPSPTPRPAPQPVPAFVPGPADCSRCLPSGATDCNSVCRNIPMPRKMKNAIKIGLLIPVGTCAFPGSTNPAQCCQCSFTRPQPPATPAGPVSTPDSCVGECLSKADCPFGLKFFTNGLPFLIDPRGGRIISPCQPDFGRFVPPCTRPGIGLAQCSQAAGTCVCP